MELAARDIVFQYGARRVLDAVSVQVQAGEVVAVLGPNGAGKSTLARILLGLAEPHLGEVSVAGQALKALTIAQRARHLAAVLQHEQHGFSFSVRELVMFARGVHSPSAADHAAVTRALAETDATHLASRPLSALSGGEQKRVLLARALAQDTPFIVLDEPTAFLDLHHQYGLASLLRTLVARGRGIVWILHDVDLALRFSDRVLVLAAGQMVAAGQASRVLTPALLHAVFAVRAERINDSTGAPHLLVI